MGDGGGRWGGGDAESLYHTIEWAGTSVNLRPLVRSKSSGIDELCGE